METKSQTDLRFRKESPIVSLKRTLNPKAISKRLAAENLTQRAFLNALAGGVGYAAQLVVSFLVNPLLLTGLGDYGYGIWQILRRLIGYLTSATGRPTQALKWTIANQQASTDYEHKRRQIGNVIAVWLLFLPLLLLLGGTVTWFAPIWLDAPADYETPIRLTAAILTFNLILGSLVAVPAAVLRGENLGYKRMGLSALLIFAGGGFTALVLYLDFGLVGLAVASTATMLLTGAVYYRIARAHVPWFGVARSLPEDVRRYLGLSGWFLVWTLVMRLMNASDVVILGFFDSPELVTSYTLTKYVPETIITFVAITVFSITPGLGGIVGSGKLQKAASVRGEIMSFTWLMVTVMGATILLWNPSFVRLWVGSEYNAGSFATLLIVLMVMQFVFVRNDASIIDLTLDLRRKVLIGFLAAMLSLVFAAVLVGPLKAGIIGLGVGFIAGRSILSVGYPWLIARALGTPLYSQLKSAVRPAIVTILLFWFVLSLSHFLAASTWLGLVLSVGITFGVTSLLVFYLGLSGQQRRRTIQRIQQVVRSASGDRVIADEIS